jgi:hypothetical protein
MWVPQARTLVGFTRARHLSNVVVTRFLLPNHDEPHTIDYPRQIATNTAIDTWGTR